MKKIRRNFQLWEKDFIYLTYLTENYKDIGNILNRTTEVIKWFVSKNCKSKNGNKIKLNDRFGKLIVKKKISNKNGIVWKCLCDCGKYMTAETNTLLSGHSKSCGCGRIEAISSKTRYVTGSYYTSLKCKAKKRNIEFNISIEYLDNLYSLQNSRCCLSGLNINIPKGRMGKKGQNITASLDRINSNIGYIENNVQFVHKDINYMKWTLNQNYFIELCKLIARNNI